VKRNDRLSLPVFAPYDVNITGNSASHGAKNDSGNKTGDDLNSRLAQEKTLRDEELANKDIRNGKDLTMRQLTRVDNRPSGNSQERYREKEN